MFATKVIEENIYLAYKPKGVSSFGFLKLLAKEMGLPKGEKIGHAGTLDPRAEGLLIVGVGAGTKKLGGYVGLPKTYEAKILLGVRTDTADLDGKVIEHEPSLFSDEVVGEALSEIKGDLFLPVPAYSAIKKAGVALYKKARNGEIFETPIRQMTVYKNNFISLISQDSSFPEILTTEARQIVTCILEVSSGTYIRSIAEFLGKKLGVPSTLAALKRIKIGNYEL